MFSFCFRHVEFNIIVFSCEFSVRFYCCLFVNISCLKYLSLVVVCVVISDVLYILFIMLCIL